MSWRGRWLAAQIAPVVLSVAVWIVTVAAWPAVAGLIAIAVVVLTVVWNMPAGLWWRHGVRALPAAAADRVWEALAPVRSLRGRGQPRLLVGRWSTEPVVVNGRDLILSRNLAEQVAAGRIADQQLAAIVLSAAGCEPVTSSRMVAGITAFCWPWHLAMLVIAPVGAGARRLPLVGIAWNIRWLIFAIAMVQSWQAGRWPALVMVAILTVLSAIHPWAARRWAARQGELGDARVIADGYGPVLAGLLRATRQPSMITLERAHRLQGSTR